MWYIPRACRSSCKIFLAVPQPSPILITFFSELGTPKSLTNRLNKQRSHKVLPIFFVQQDPPSEILFTIKYFLCFSSLGTNLLIIMFPARQSFFPYYLMQVCFSIFLIATLTASSLSRPFFVFNSNGTIALGHLLDIQGPLGIS